MELMKDKTEVY